MRTDELIERLASAGARPPRAMALRFALPLAGAAALCAILLSLALGAPAPDLSNDGLAAFVMKEGFAATIALTSAIALFTAGRPATRQGPAIAVLLVAFAALAALALADLVVGAADWPGSSWRRCFAAICLLTPVAFAGAAFALRRLAPVRLRITGALAGAFSAAAAAATYAFWCPEDTALFLFSWYALPIAAMAGLGAWFGPKFLRW